MRPRTRGGFRAIAALAAALLPAVPAAAQGPRLELVYPRCVQRGQEVELQLRGRDLPEPRQLLSETLDLELLEVVSSNKRRADVRVRGAAPPSRFGRANDANSSGVSWCGRPPRSRHTRSSLR